MQRATAPVATRSERAWRFGVMATAGALFASTTSSSVHFGDSAEGVAGVASVGILHAPGYVAWVAAARLFSILVPIGGIELRVALFSGVCATATVGVVFALARRLGASAPGAAVGALSLAVSSSFWFYAAYAKAYALTSLLIAVALWSLVAWKDAGRRWLLVLAGACIGISLGAAWQSMAVALPGLALLLFAADRRPGRADLVAVAASGLTAAGSVFVWVLVRAGADPAVTWGGATTPGRAVRLLLMRDFINLQGTGAGTAGGQQVVSGSNVVALAVKLLRLPFVLNADLGLGLLALVVVGTVVAYGRRATTRWWPLVVIYLANVVAVLTVISPGRRPRGLSISRENLLRTGGFTLAAAVALACIIAIGATWSLAKASELLISGSGSKRSKGRTSAQRRAQKAVAATRPSARWPGLVAAGVVLAGTAAYHWQQATHHAPPFAAEYAANVLRSVPPDSVLLTNLLERSFSLEYAQVVLDIRPDVDLVQIEKLPASWYRSDVERRLGLTLGDSPRDAFSTALVVADKLQGTRPVYYDASALVSLVAARSDLGYRAVGLVAEALPTGEGQSYDASEAGRLLATYRLQGLFDHPARLRYPNRSMLVPYSATFTDQGIALAKAGKYAEARRSLRQALDVTPGDKTAIQALEELEALVAERSGADGGAGAPP